MPTQNMHIISTNDIPIYICYMEDGYSTCMMQSAHQSFNNAHEGMYLPHKLIIRMLHRISSHISTWRIELHIPIMRDTSRGRLLLTHGGSNSTYQSLVLGFSPFCVGSAWGMLVQSETPPIQQAGSAQCIAQVIPVWVFRFQFQY